MSNDTLALLISGISLLGTGFNAWLKLQIRADIQQLEKDIMREVAKDFVRREVADREWQEIEERRKEFDRRVTLLESARWK